MNKLKITSDIPMSKMELEEELIKAGKSVALQHEKKEFTDLYLKDHKTKVAKAVKLVFVNMLNEINKVLKEQPNHQV